MCIISSMPRDCKRHDIHQRRRTVLTFSQWLAFPRSRISHGCLAISANKSRSARRIMLFRFGIFVGLSSVVTTIIYFTPIPEQTFLSCDRPCHHLDWPMICRVKLTLEVFQSLSKSCGDCPLNQTACLANNCVSVDGQRRGILTANRQMPGPSIQVCENDILVVDVINRLPGKAAVVHWRGQTQMEMPYMDGTPLVTQCPIPSYTTFQYKFRASIPGTHLWHAHAGADVMDGIIGSLIVRQADLREPHRALYDIDDPNHVVLVTQWQHSSDTFVSFNEGYSKPAILLINGKGRQPSGPAVPLSIFTVIPGRRHRFRVANAGGAGVCPVTLFIDGHSLLLIALDGHPIEPRQITSITLAKGERADFVVKASKRIGSYWMNVHTVKECGTSTINGAAMLNYKGNSENPAATAEAIDQHDSDEIGTDRVAVTTNPAEKCGDRENLCAMDIQSIRKISQALTKPRTDVILYLPINYKMQATELIGNGGTETRVLNVNNVTFTFPPSPLLTQGGDVSPGMLCTNNDDNEKDLNESNETVSRRRCRQVGDVGAGDICECVHVRHVPLGATVEIILLDQGGLDDLVYHLHGYSFYVVGSRQFGRSMSLQEVKKLDERSQLFSRNLDCALIKDTIVVPKFGAVALRFKADNPGYWMLRDEHATDWTRGLDIILQVGEPSDMVTPPQDFPKCGSFVGPDYFLI